MVCELILTVKNMFVFFLMQSERTGIESGRTGRYGQGVAEAHKRRLRQWRFPKE